MTVNTLRDEDLLEGIRTGRAAELFHLYANFLPSVIRVLRQRGATRTVAEDIFEDVLTALFIRLQKRPLTLHNCKLQTYITGNCIKRYLSHSRGRKFRAEVTPEELTVLDDNEDLEEELQQSEQYRLYRKHFKQLPETCRLVLHELLVERQPLQKIAELMDYSYDYVKKKSSQCQKQLKASIQADPRFKELKN